MQQTCRLTQQNGWFQNGQEFKNCWKDSTYKVNS